MPIQSLTTLRILKPLTLYSNVSSGVAGSPRCSGQQKVFCVGTIAEVIVGNPSRRCLIEVQDGDQQWYGWIDGADGLSAEFV